jgi:hypothetical protein
MIGRSQIDGGSGIVVINAISFEATVQKEEAVDLSRERERFWNVLLARASTLALPL